MLDCGNDIAAIEHFFVNFATLPKKRFEKDCCLYYGLSQKKTWSFAKVLPVFYQRSRIREF